MMRNSLEGSELLVNPVQITGKLVRLARNPNAEPLKLNDVDGSGTDAEIAAAVALQDSDFGRRAVRQLLPNIDLVENFDTIENLHQSVGLVGAYTFSFPLWRTPAQQPKKGDGEILPSYFEKRWWEKVCRKTDKRQPQFEEPSQDWLGSGYRSKKDAATFDQQMLDILTAANIDPKRVYIEYRRSYILISIEGEGSLVIRNSSYYFGRDNFKHAAYFSHQHLSDEEIEAFSPEMVDNSSPRLEALFDPAQSWNLSHSGNLLTLAKVFQSIDRSLFDFGRTPNEGGTFNLKADNFRYLLDHLAERIPLDRESTSYPIVGVFDAGLPPWSPRFSFRVSPEILDEVSTMERTTDARSPVVRAFIQEAAKPGRTVGLMSSVDGDLPFKAQTINSANVSNPILVSFIQSKVKKDLMELGIDGLVEPSSSTLFPNFRQLDFPKIVQSIVEWLADKVQPAPGLVVSLSGTDSVLTFLLCSKALKSLGRDPNRELIGTHFRSSQEAYPYHWLSQHGSVQSLEPPISHQQDADIERWAAVQSFAIQNGRLWMVGSRNATEAHTGDYSIASNCCSLFPVSNLLKTEVLNMCHSLGVPIKEINQSLGADPECDAACVFQSRRVVSMDCFVLADLHLLSPDLVEHLNPEIRRIYGQRIAEGDFRKAYQRFNND